MRLYLILLEAETVQLPSQAREPAETVRLPTQSREPRESGYAVAGDGHCDDWVYLPEGGYPDVLTDSNPLYDEDRIQECMNRCVNAANEGSIGSNSHGDPNIRNLAFYIRLSDQACGCSSGECSTLTPDPSFRSYYTGIGNFEAFM